MSLISLVRRLGFRRGWRVWRIGQEVALDQATAERVHPWRVFHGQRPSLNGYRRRR